MPSSTSRDADRKASARRNRVDALERLSITLDSRFRVPVLGIRVGWDSILGLIPGLGDLVTAGPGAVMLYEAWRMGARKRAMARIGVNTGVDMLMGSVPLLGDLFDVAFKSHRRNAAILKSELARIEQRELGDRAALSDEPQPPGRAS